ncbi:MAG: hypothetical protein KGL39_30140 [Patescibacteria group bacterium]|nr:hypothetical protein [Patescibacteria group bacterium]
MTAIPAEEAKSAARCHICGVLVDTLAAQCPAAHGVCSGCFSGYQYAFVRLGGLELACPEFDCGGQLKPNKHAKPETKQQWKVTLTALSSESAEYKELATMFEKQEGAGIRFVQLKGATIEKIFRIDNPGLAAVYEMCRERMARNPSGANEQRLFHGTSRAASGGIAREGFDLRRAGSKVGQAFGPGVYFGTCSAVSHAYTEEDSRKDRCMLVCRVLLGDCKKDSTAGPGLYVVNREQQILPTHVIYYAANDTPPT